MALGGALTGGSTVVLARRFSVRRFWEDCVRYDVTIFQYIGELCRYLVNAPRQESERRHRVRLCVGNGLRPEVWEPFRDRFRIPEIIEFYGATEGNVSLVNLDNKVGSVGRLARSVQLLAGFFLVRFDVEEGRVVRGEDGFCIEAAVGEPGEAIGRITKATRFEGYSDAEASEAKILRNVFRRGDAFFLTGDLLRRDRDGYFYFVDRIGDTFRWKGENVSTSEVAEAIATTPGVEEVSVYGVEVVGTDGRAGMASLVVNEEFSMEALVEHLDADLAAYARPVFLRLSSEIETTGTFKHRKVDAIREGFDPSIVGDPLYVFDSKAHAFVPLDPDVFEEIQSGMRRF